MKNYLMISAAALVMLAACAKETADPAVSDKRLSFNATVEQQVDPADTKTALSGSSVVWSIGDAVKVFDETGKAGKMVADASGSTSVHFTQEGSLETGFNEAGAICAMYPWTAGASFDGSVITFTLPATQYYTKDSFDPACNVTVGTLSAGKVSFKNAFGLLKLSLVGNMKVSRIELVGNNDEKMNGTFTVNPADADPAAAGGSAASAAEKKATLDCFTNYPNQGVNLDPDTPTAFYFVVPAAAFGDASNGGFTATVYDWAGDSYNVVLSTTKKSNIIVRSKVRAMDNATANLTILEAGYTLKKWVKSTMVYVVGDPTQTASINTGIPGGNDELEIDCVVEYNTRRNWKAFYGNYPTELAESEGHDAEDYAVTRLLLNNNSSAIMGLYINSKCLDGYNRWSVAIPTADDTRYCTFNSKSYFAVDGIKIVKTGTAGLYPNNTNIALFSARLMEGKYGNPATEAGTSSTTIYNMRIKDNGTLVRLFIPCVNSSSEAGFYDLVNGKFYGNDNILADPPYTELGTLTTD